MGVKRRLVPAFSVVAATVPGSALAGGCPHVLIALDPTAFLAPLLGALATIILAVVLLSLGFVAIYRQSTTTRRVLIIGIAVVVAAGMGWVQAAMVAIEPIDGPECAQQAVKLICNSSEVGMRNDCDDPVRIVDIDIVGCVTGDIIDPVAPACQVGGTLTPNQVCNLPWCAL